MAGQGLSKQTKRNWWTDALLMCSAMVAALTGIYFLYLPTGGYQGGRNPLYNVTIIFPRNTWDDLHTWGGIAMIAIAVIHIIIHWRWIVNMTKRTWNELTGKCGCLNPRGRWNLMLNAIVAASFVFTAISGIYFLFLRSGRWTSDPLMLFNQDTWDMLHTWSGITLISGAIIHLTIHWRWVANVTSKMVRRIIPSRPRTQPAESPTQNLLGG